MVKRKINTGKLTVLTENQAPVFDGRQVDVGMPCTATGSGCLSGNYFRMSVSSLHTSTN